jgi:predicted O-linked N-acetylglucosamine transferase (SPINDLY family)
LQGISELRRGAAISPSDPVILVGLAALADDAGSEWQLRLLAIGDDHDAGAIWLYARYLHQGRLGEAATFFDRNLERLGPQAHASRICLSYLMDDERPPQSLRMAQDFDRRFCRDVAWLVPKQTVRLSNRKLRIGYVAGSAFQAHTASLVLLPTMAEHDRRNVEIFCYSDLDPGRYDDVTRLYQQNSTAFRSTHGLNDAAFASAILADRIDVVIDMLGFTLGSRLPALARRPAGMLVNWMLMGTFGMSAFDVVIGDQWTTPVGAEAWFSERLVRTSLSICYSPLIHVPEAAPSPDRAVVFGSFNQVPKISERCVRLWSAVLRALPTARLVLKAAGFVREGPEQRLRAAFQRQGIAADRIEIRQVTPGIIEHLEQYADIDVALDTTPYGGVISTLEALYMGVPVISLVGDRVLGRFAYAFLSVLGLSGLIAASAEEYVSKAVALAQDVDRRQRLRATLRSQMVASPICDGRRMAGEIEGAILNPA